jgi:hypothetical protein
MPRKKKIKVGMKATLYVMPTLSLDVLVIEDRGLLGPGLKDRIFRVQQGDDCWFECYKKYLTAK